MRDDAKSQLNIVNAKIAKAKTSLEEMREIAEPKTLSMELADLIPLGQFPEEETDPSKRKKKPQ